MRYETIVVDDVSKDGSGDLAENIEGTRVLRFAINRGVGSARKYRTTSARGRVVVWTDVDITYPNDRITEPIKGLEGFNQVVGARNSEEEPAKVFSRPAKWMIRKRASYLSCTDIPDLNSDLTVQLNSRSHDVMPATSD